jgi:solute:Na+ symporter, SSS family
MHSAALIVDGLIIILYFALIVGLGMYVGRRKKANLEEYALGGRRLPWWAIMASIISAETSAATFIGAPAEGFTNRGIIYVQLAFGIILARILVAFVFLKPYYDYRVYTVYDFLRIRFGSKTKNYISALFLVMRTLGSGVRLYVPSLVLVLAWRLFVRREPVHYGQIESWLPYLWAILALTLVTCLYTAVGGIKGVIWTDVIQATVMFISALVAIGSILWDLGDGSITAGFASLAHHVPEMTTRQGYFLTGFEGVHSGMGWREVIGALFSSKYTLPSALIGYTVFCMGAYGTDQDMVQRMLTASDYRRSRRSVIGAGLMDVPIFASFAFIGVLLIAFYQRHPQLLPAKANDVFGAYILGVMPVVVRGFVLAGVFATAMGSTAAALNALATSLTNDWYIPYIAPNRPPGHYVTAARISTAIFALLLIVVATVCAFVNVRYPGVTVIPIVLGVAGFILGPMLGVFLLGMLTRTRGSDRGNMLAVTAGLITIFVASGRHIDVANLFAPSGTLYALPRWFPRVEFTWYVLIGAAATVAVGILFRTPSAVVRGAVREDAQPEPAVV